MEKLWPDKYRPLNLRELSYNEGLTEMLTRVAERQDFPHMLLYGPSGAGKKTRVMCFLNELFGPNVYKLRV
jgi:replication factor C subunit 3/5